MTMTEIPPGLSDALLHCAAYGPLARALLLSESPARHREMLATAAAVLPLRGWRMAAGESTWRSPRGAAVRVRHCPGADRFADLAGEWATLVVADAPPDLVPLLPSLLRSAGGVPTRAVRYTARPD